MDGAPRSGHCPEYGCIPTPAENKKPRAKQIAATGAFSIGWFHTGRLCCRLAEERSAACVSAVVLSLSKKAKTISSLCVYRRNNNRSTNLRVSFEGHAAYLPLHLNLLHFRGVPMFLHSFYTSNRHDTCLPLFWGCFSVRGYQAWAALYGCVKRTSEPYLPWGREQQVWLERRFPLRLALLVAGRRVRLRTICR